MADDQEAYVVREIPLKERLIKAAKIAVPVIGTGLAIGIFQFNSNVPIEGYWITALILGAGCYFSWKAFRTDISKELTGEWVRPTVSPSIRKRVLIAGVLGAIASVALVYIQLSFGYPLLVSLLPTIPVAIILALYIGPQLRPPKVFVPSAVAAEEQKRLETEQAINAKEDKRKTSEMEEKWWFRYGMAIFLVAAAWWIADHKPKAEWIAILMVLSAMFFARELSLFILGALALWLVFQGIATIPISVAVIIGACIIAYAINRSKD